MRTHLCAASLLVAAAALAACAGRPTVRDQVAASQDSIEAMASATAATTPLNDELAMARIKLARAQAALHVGDYERGRRLAEQAELDAQIACAKIAAGRLLRAVAVDANAVGVKEAP